MRELLICKNQYNRNVGFYSYNSEKLFVWNEKIEKNNLYAVTKVDGCYEILKVIGLADGLVDQIRLSGNVVQLIELDEDEINGQTYDLRDLANTINNAFGEGE